jgi:hypothetical protein
MTQPVLRQSVFADPLAEGPSPLTTSGRQIVDALGRTVVLRGTNIGGWLLQECWMSPAGDATLAGHARFAATAFASEPDALPQTVLEPGPGRWTSGQPQASGQWITVDMGRPRTFNQISVDAGDWPQDSPEGLVIRISDDGHAWRDVGWVGGVARCHVLRLPHLTARFVQVMLTHPRPGQWWSVTETRLTVSDEFHTRSRLADRFGPEQAQALLDVYRDHWFTDADFDRLAGIGFNCLRLPIDWQLIMDASGQLHPVEDAFARIDWFLHQAAARGMYVILDLHGLPGGANPWHSSGIAGSNAFWRDPICQARTENIWRAIAQRYRGHPAVAAYDLINEPLVTMGGAESPTEVVYKFEVTDRLYRAVRAEDPDHIIMVAVFPDWEHALPPAQFGWTNVVYQTHHYNFAAQDHHDGMRAFIRHEMARMERFRDDWGMPVYAGEFWFAGFTDLYDEWLSGLNRLGLSWTSWSYKVKNPPGARGADGIQHGDGWSLYFDAPYPVPDLDRDTAGEIAAKWAAFRTENFKPNNTMQAIYRRHARQEADHDA